MKRALVLSGGGIAGSYEVGAITHLLNLGIEFDIICGSSVGAINAAFLSQYKKDNFEKGCKELIKFWKNLEQKNIYKRWFPFGKLHSLWKKSLYNSKPLKELIEKNIDENKIFESKIELRVGTVSVKSGKYKIYDQKSKDIINAIVASASFPPFFSPVKINDDLEYDAGIREYTPIRSAIDAGATEIYVICSDSNKLPPIDNTDKMNSIDLLKRFLNTMALEIILEDLKQVEIINQKILSGDRKEKKIIKCHVIKPNKQLVEDSLKFDHETITKLMGIGYNDAVQQIK
jgi:NTE family protein